MTYEEAINELKEYAKASWGGLAESFECAIEALEKQIPKKVEWTEDYTWGKRTDQPVCPVCDYYLPMHHFIGEGKKVSYCDTCGQAISWEE